MRVLVFGTTGQVARNLTHIQDAQAELIQVPRGHADFTEPASCLEAIEHYRPHAIINAVAYTDVDGAEKDEATAQQVNATTPGLIAQHAAKLDIPLVHISTDYVFDGTGSVAWTPSDPVAPLNAYGRTKAAGEQAIRAAGGQHVILRTAWVFADDGKNFVSAILNAARKRPNLQVVCDQVGGPTHAVDIARAVVQIAAVLTDTALSGTYHYAGTPDIRRSDFARIICKTAGLDTDIKDIQTQKTDQTAQRPLNSRLDCSTTYRDFKVQPPSWEPHLKRALL